jgi:hypothetical protein
VGEPTRERVRATIGQVGGYWRPLAAVARMQEELGELAELLLASPDAPLPGNSNVAAPEDSYAPPSGDSDTAQAGNTDVANPCGERFTSELADLWIITTVLSDQFLGAVAEPGSYRGHRPDDGVDRASGGGEAVRGDLLGDLLVAAGRIARIVNYYDGPKTPRAFEGWISLGEAVAGFHRAIAQAAHAHGVDLAKAVNAKLDAIPALDSGRFGAAEHDPSTAASLEWFRAARVSSAGFDLCCARMWGAPEWSSEPAVSIQAIVADLTSFTKAAIWERLDAYLICCPTRFSSAAILDEWLKRLLLEIAARDPMGGDSTTVPEPTVAGERRFTFNGLDLFVSVLPSPGDATPPRGSPSDARDSSAATHSSLTYAHGSLVGTFVLLRVDHAADPPAAQ